ncbi:hypothetical protein Cni_G27904 [Canna indica]|uniref:PRA1 family protein n=1 Tax=Canna indica TaxID=4628 RepID=A0AAQ3L1L8_9LILI|nr:hypothetical protein Cni_G27904 [Canna indica]
MVFAANPLSLSVTEPAFEAWLRDSGYLEVLDNRTTAAADSPSLPDLLRPRAAAAATSPASLAAGFSALRTLASLFTLNPFAKLTSEDFTGETPSWTLEFIGRADSYSWPAGPSQARMRVQENFRRYARNYGVLSVLVFACSLYKLPVSLLGLLTCLLLWEFLGFFCGRWHLEERCPGLRQVLISITLLATAMILYACNLQLAITCAAGVSYAVIVFHAFFRKLTPKQPSRGNQYKTVTQKKVKI